MEILVVIVIIGILVSIGIGGLISSQKKGRDARRKEDLHQIAIALEVYYHDAGEFPQSDAGRIAGCGLAATPVPCDWGKMFSNDNGIYMVQLPVDPIKGYQYHYNSPDGSYFELYALIENQQDKDLIRNDSDVVRIFEGTNCEAASCNYAITSTNRQKPTPVDPT